jgi:hypothetical protein
MVIQWLALAISQESVEGFEYDQIACVVRVHSIESNIKKQNLFKSIPLNDVACLSESPRKSMVMCVLRKAPSAWCIAYFLAGTGGARPTYFLLFTDES